MSDHPAPITPETHKGTLGDRIRTIADQLTQDRTVQIQATSRILGAAAKISENHDRLIDEVVDMVEEDLDQQAQIQPAEPHAKPYTAEQLKRHFKTLNSAKTHFGLKASSWVALAAKLNHQTDGLKQPTVSEAKDSAPYRLEAIEHEIQSMRTDMKQVLQLLDIILKKL